MTLGLKMFYNIITNSFHIFLFLLPQAHLTLLYHNRVFPLDSPHYVGVEQNGQYMAREQVGLYTSYHRGNIMASSEVTPRHETKYIDLKLDHFGYATDVTFKLRYLINRDHWNRDGGPIFFYTGNEGDITAFANNTGFMWDIAPEFEAMVVFAEHRYYGKSKPFVNCCKKSQLAYLTSEQALADYAELIYHLKLNIPGAIQSPVIVFGGSYGGMLAAWFRIKYPHLAHGAIAASAPVVQFTGLTPCDRFNQVVTRTFGKAGRGGGGVQCVRNIRRSWEVMNKLGQTGAGRLQLVSSLRLCDPLSSAADVDVVKAWLAGVWVSLTMCDYPYPASFLAPMPAWPVTAACSYLNHSGGDDHVLLATISQAAGVFLNYTGQAGRCFNVSQSIDAGMDDQLWGYQSCTEMVMPMCSDGVSDMFEPQPWNLSVYDAGCMSSCGTLPQPHWIPLQFGGQSLKAISNIVFSNGQLDPWSSGGIRHDITPSVVALQIESGAHHLDLRAANPRDPPDVRRVREQEKNFIKHWINEDKQT